MNNQTEDIIPQTAEEKLAKANGIIRALTLTTRGQPINESLRIVCQLMDDARTEMEARRCANDTADKHAAESHSAIYPDTLWEMLLQRYQIRSKSKS